MKDLAFRTGQKLLVAFALVFLLNASTRADDSVALYKASCASCHGADGKGDTPLGRQMGARDFASPEVRKETDKQLIEITAMGKKNMPAYKSTLKDSQIKDLVGYIDELAKRK